MGRYRRVNLCAESSFITSTETDEQFENQIFIKDAENSRFKMMNPLKRKMVNAVPIETDGDEHQQQQKEFREKFAQKETELKEANKKIKVFRGKFAKKEMELKEANQLCKIKDLEKRALQFELEKQNLMVENNVLKAKIDMMEKEKEKQNEEGRYASVDQFTNLQNDLFGLIHELDVKQQQQQEKKGKYVSADQFNGIMDELKKQQQMIINRQMTTDSNLANAFQTKFAGLETLQKKMESFIELLKEQTEEIVLADELEQILGRIGELEKKQQNEQGTSSTTAENGDSNPPNVCCWDVNSCSKDIEITGEKCLAVHSKGIENGCRSVFAKHSFSLNNYCSGIFYYEITAKKINRGFNFGVAVKHYPQMLDEIIYRSGTFAYSSYGNFCINGKWKSRNSGYSYRAGDVVGFGVNLATRQIIFTKNGHILDTTNYFISQCSSAASPLFPFVSLYSFGDKIEANFEPNFKFETDL
ncbi:hypothetical protein niasHS_004169 [Heterodera schachtii]|uniref:B30.2/SPRY domain-containing protein n=1 Tax=Heterodera schachtii TaxID=97005 RepID=A0ABD2JZZ9_HETSC